MSIAEKLQTIAENEQKVYNAGYEKGKAEGGNTEEAYNNGFEAGKKSEYDRFWDKYQDNGNRVNYQYGFAGHGWNKENFKPKYSMYPEQMSTGFWHFGINDTDIENAVDFVEVFDNRGLVFDTSNCANFTSLFMWANIKRLGVIDVRKINTGFNSTFAYGKIKTIDKLIINENVQFTTSVFQNQATLENITFEGVLAKTGLDLHWSTKLSKVSIESVINCLSANTSDLTVTLSLIAVKKAFETTSGANDGNTSEEWLNLIATKPNWTITLV